MLLPFLKRPVRIAPRMDRTVLFWADRVLHRVLPSNAQRVCFTLWFDSGEANADADLFLRQKHLTLEALPLLQAGPLQRVLSRAVYREAYAESLRQCYGAEGKSARVALALHQAHIKGLLANNAALQGFIEELRARRPWCSEAEDPDIPLV